jgi:hypothetical protein
MSVQVCSYRVLASYESPLLEDFSRCILQKHNCLRNSAEIPMVPAPQPLSTFQGKPLTFEAAEDIFIGNLADSHGREAKPFSWRVAAGKNPGAPQPSTFAQFTASTSCSGGCCTRPAGANAMVSALLTIMYIPITQF